MVHYFYFILCGIVVANEVIQNTSIKDSEEMRVKGKKSKSLFSRLKKIFEKRDRMESERDSGIEMSVDGFEENKEKNKWWKKIKSKLKKNRQTKPVGINTEDLPKNFDCSDLLDERAIQPDGKNVICNFNSGNKNTENSKIDKNPTIYEEQVRNHKNSEINTSDQSKTNRKEKVIAETPLANSFKNTESTPLLTQSSTSPSYQNNSINFSKTNSSQEKERLARVSSVNIPLISNDEEKLFNGNIYKGRNNKKARSSSIASPSMAERQKIGNILDEKINDTVELNTEWRRYETVCITEPFDKKDNINFQTTESSTNVFPSDKNSTTEESSNTFILEDKNKIGLFNTNKLSIWTILFVASISFTISFLIMMILK